MAPERWLCRSPPLGICRRKASNREGFLRTAARCRAVRSSAVSAWVNVPRARLKIRTAYRAFRLTGASLGEGALYRVGWRPESGGMTDFRGRRRRGGEVQG